jgi:hypothetical protein
MDINLPSRLSTLAKRGSASRLSTSTPSARYSQEVKAKPYHEQREDRPRLRVISIYSICITYGYRLTLTLIYSSEERITLVNTCEQRISLVDAGEEWVTLVNTCEQRISLVNTCEQRISLVDTGEEWVTLVNTLK